MGEPKDKCEVCGNDYAVAVRIEKGEIVANGGCAHMSNTNDWWYIHEKEL